MIIKVVSFDPSMRAFGMASLLLDTATMKFEVCDLKLIETERMVTKQVRQNSDDLRRAQELAVEFKAFCKGAQIGFTEVPSGAQNARAAYSFGMMIGLLANAPISLIQVMPSETKLATVGTKTASKDEMIEHGADQGERASRRRRCRRARRRQDRPVQAACDHVARLERRGVQRR